MAGTLYDVLGVGPGASAGDLRAAYRERARRLHPDVSSGDAAAMRSLNDAWAVLSDHTRRAAYDRRRTVAGPGASGRDDGSGRPVSGSTHDGSSAHPPTRLRLWPLLVLGAGLLVVVTAYAGRPADTRTQVEPVGQCLVEGADLDRTEPCRSAGGRRIVAVGGPGVQCPERTDTRALRGDPATRTACVPRVAGR